jgi:RNA polymerase sigma-70 factor (ECF subfamily)
VQTSKLDASQIETLYREHGAVLVLFAAAITGDRSTAQDAVHQVFLKMIERGSPSNVKDWKAFLFTSVRNAVLNDLRVRQRNVELHPDSAWFSPPEQDDDAEQSLQLALRTLPDDQRQVTVLHVWGDLTFSQISDVLGISANTAASRYRYALAKLREALSGRKDPNERP